MTYGYEVHGRHDKMLNASKRMINFAQENVLPGALLVNYLPCPGRHLVGATIVHRRRIFVLSFQYRTRGRW